jgi:hypothetical protein
MQPEFLITILFFVFVFLFGYILSRTGKPYNSLIFNFHKLIGLAMGVFLLVSVYKAYQSGPFSHIQILSLVITLGIFVILVAAGGLLSIEAGGNLKSISPTRLAVISAVHKALPYLALLATAWTLYLLFLLET